MGVTVAAPTCDRLVGHGDLVLDARFHLRLAHREIAVLHLHRHDALRPFARHGVERGMQRDGVAGNEDGDEERQALDVIPVAVRVEDVGGDGQFLEQRLRQREDAGAAVEDDERAIVGAYLDAGGVAAVAHGARPRRRDGAAHAPESDFHAAPPTATGEGRGLFHDLGQIAQARDDLLHAAEARGQGRRQPDPGEIAGLVRRSVSC